MKKISLVFLAIIICSWLAAGCAPKAYKPVDLNPLLKTGKLVQKTDNFIILFDQSASMDNSYKGGPRLALARDTAKRLVETIPDIKLNAGLRTFWAENTALVYGMTPFEKTALINAVQSVVWGNGRTPMGRTIAAAGEDLKPFTGPSAMIIISDFEDIKSVDDLRSESVMENIGKVKEDYRDRLCIYAIQIGQAPNGKKLAQEIADAGKCGLAVNADDLTEPEKMASFVEKVFLGPPALVMEKPAAKVETKPEETKAEAAAPVETTAKALAALENIHFDFDKSFLRPGDRNILKQHSEWLLQNRNYSVVIEGHCDERGTTEYNLALGQRRADAALKYLVDMGVESNRLKTISYGKERPLDPGHNEEAWAKNRRDQFILTPIK